MITEKEIENRFRHHTPNQENGYNMSQIRSLCSNLATQIVGLTPVSREQTLAIGKLEEAMFWANAAIARQ